MSSSKYILIILIFAISFQAISQEAKFKLYGEKVNEVVRLAWIPEYWPANMDGVIIKKRTEKSAWELVTPAMVVPSSYVGKDLSNIESSPTERLRLNNKLDSMISAGKAKEVPQSEYFEKILQESASLSGIAFIFALDYDLILLNGFGCVDRGIDSGIDYEYGVFVVLSGETQSQPVVTHKTGAVKEPDINIALAPRTKVIGNNKKLRLHWQFDLYEYRKKQIKGFNIYEVAEDTRRVKLNDNVIWITAKEDPADLNFIVDFPTTAVEYLATPVSYFGFEAEGHKIDFNPDFYKIAIQPPKLSYTIDNLKVNFVWQLDHGYDSLIRNFKILKRAEESEFVVFGETKSTARNFTAELNAQGEQSRYKVIAETITDKEIWSNESIINYTPPKMVPAPKNLVGEVINKESGPFIELKWEYPQTDETIGFRIYTEGPNGGLIYDSSLPKDIKSPFEFEIKKSRGQLYRFAVLARTPDRKTSLLSNEIEVLGPSKILPSASITQIVSVDGGVEVEWKFSSEVADLLGFRILLDGDVLLSENEINQDQRSVLLTEIDSGKHTVSLIAVTVFGLESRPSFPKNIIMP